MERRALLEVKHLNSFYEEGNGILSAGKRRKQVLQDVSFSLYQGEVLGLVGESGSGKTTLSRAIVGLLRDYTGELLLHTATPPQMVFQDPYSSLNPAHTIGWILEEPLSQGWNVQSREKSTSWGNAGQNRTWAGVRPPKAP